MNKKEEKYFRQEFEKQLKHQFTRGLLQGSQAMCGAILDIIKQNNNDPKDAIQKVEQFCTKSLGLPSVE